MFLTDESDEFPDLFRAAPCDLPPGRILGMLYHLSTVRDSEPQVTRIGGWGPDGGTRTT